MKIKVITEEHERLLENKVNDFIKDREDIIDIKYSISSGGVYSHREYSVMIIMKGQ